MTAIRAFKSARDPQLIGQQVEVRLTATMVEVYRHGRRVASHRRDDTPYRSTTDPRHRPPNHQAVFDGTRDRLMQWAREVGEATTELMQRLLDPAHNFSGSTRRRSGYGLRTLGDKYERARVEEACRRVLAFEQVSYKSVERILRTSPDMPPSVEELSFVDLEGLPADASTPWQLRLGASHAFTDSFALAADLALYSPIGSSNDPVQTFAPPTEDPLTGDVPSPGTFIPREWYANVTTAG